jgi:hypothetical protein
MLAILADVNVQGGGLPTFGHIWISATLKLGENDS